MTGGVTTGTAYNDYTYSFGDCDGNYIQADMYNIRTQPLTLTSDGDNQGVYNNEFHLTEHGGPRTYFSSHTNTRIYHNTIYMDFEDTRGGLYFEKGFITDNVFYVSFKNSGIGGYTDISHDNANWAGVTNNVINVISTSGNPNGLSDFVSGTQGNIINHVG